MNLLTLTIGPCGDNSTTGEGTSFLVTAAVDGVSLPEWLDVDEFFRSLVLLREAALKRVTKSKPSPKKARASAATNLLPIFNCSCGCFGCGGYSVQMTLTREALVWETSFVRVNFAKGEAPVAR